MGKLMNSIKNLRQQGSLTLVLLLLAACSSTDQSAELAAAEAARQEEVRQEELAAEQARLERERAQREAEAQALREAEAEARLQAQREAEAEAARREAELARQAAAREAELARQQARVRELQARIAATRNETADINAENTVLREAVRAAENLADALDEESGKYSDIDPDTGTTVEALAQDRLQELGAELERLQQQLDGLQSP